MSEVTPVAAPVVADASAPVPDASAPPVEAQTAAEIRRHKVKIDGNEVEVDEPELLKSYERSKASYKRFEEAAKRAKEIEARESEFTETLKFVRDPKTRADALARLLGGEDALVDLATDVLAKRMEWEAMPEPERKRRSEMTEREKRIADEERRIAEREKAVEKKREAEIAAEATRLQETFTKEWPALLKKAGAPSSRNAISRMANVMREALEIGVDITPGEAAQRVADELREEYRAMASESDPETLRALLGPGADKVRAAEIARVQAQPGRVAPKEQPPARREGPKREPTLTTEQLRKKLLAR